jgi:hypothetical protein
VPKALKTSIFEHIVSYLDNIWDLIEGAKFTKRTLHVKIDNLLVFGRNSSGRILVWPNVHLAESPSFFDQFPAEWLNIVISGSMNMPILGNIRNHLDCDYETITSAIICNQNTVINLIKISHFSPHFRTDCWILGICFPCRKCSRLNWRKLMVLIITFTTRKGF